MHTFGSSVIASSLSCSDANMITHCMVHTCSHKAWTCLKSQVYITTHTWCLSPRLVYIIIYLAYPSVCVQFLWVMTFQPHTHNNCSMSLGHVCPLYKEDRVVVYTYHDLWEQSPRELQSYPARSKHPSEMRRQYHWLHDLHVYIRTTLVNVCVCKFGRPGTEASAILK